jgi:transposase
VEIITGRERRRRWSLRDKLRIVDDTREPGARICDVAARHGVCESLVFTWRRQARDGLLAEPETQVFMPVQTLAARANDGSVRTPGAACHYRIKARLIEIELGDGRKGMHPVRTAGG